MDAKRLLAEATAETLREDAEYAERRADLIFAAPRERDSLLRLAELARAVAEVEDRSLDLRAASTSDDDVLWSLIEHWMSPPHERPVTEYNSSAMAALSTLLPEPEDTTDGR